MVITMLLLGLALSLTAGAAASAGKVSPALQDALQVKGRVDIFVSFGDDQTLARIARSSLRSDRSDRATTVYEGLKAHSLKTQSSVLSMLRSTRFSILDIQSFWITNQIYVKGADAGIVHALASMDEVSDIDEEVIVHLSDTIHEPQSRATGTAWGIKKIQATKAWNVVGRGDGCTVGVIDTGVRVTHEALRSKFVGGTHAWYDPYLQSKLPTDLNGRGTHVTGTILGDLNIGVAPGSKWIACKGFKDDGSATQSKLLECGQFMFCPHDFQQKNPKCSLAPAVVSHAWGLTAAFKRNFYEVVIAAFNNANIIPVFAAGDAGPKCRSILFPADAQGGLIAVGATGPEDAIANYSSRGPSAYGTNQRPHVSAPGSLILSAGIESDSAYKIMSGTAMASAHVTGLVALLKSHVPSATVVTIRRILESTADTKGLVFDSSVCNGVSESKLPSFAFGYGRINAFAACNAIA